AARRRGRCGLGLKKAPPDPPLSPPARVAGKPGGAGSATSRPRGHSRPAECGPRAAFVRGERCRDNHLALFSPQAVVSVDGRPVRLQLCDTAGQDEFDKLRPLCYTNADIFLLCFSVVSPTSFQNVSEKWVPEIRCHCPKAPIILVGTQSDLREDVKVLIELDKCKEKPVPEEAAKLCAEEIKAVSYIECSALTQKNLKEVFDAAIVAGIQHSDSQQQPKKSKSRTPEKVRDLSKSWWRKYCCLA
uniref:Ras homolog family member U n=1 Tax=Peromyscus maniculatus bairdii TaxID=230844 RepID=A0A8C9CT79_PERMB